MQLRTKTVIIWELKLNCKCIIINCRPLIRQPVDSSQRDAALTPPINRFLRLKIWWTSVNFVAQNSWEYRKAYTHTETLDVPSTSYKNIVDFGAVNHWDVVAQKVDRCTHAKIGTFALFPPESIDWSAPNFQQM